VSEGADAFTPSLAAEKDWEQMDERTNGGITEGRYIDAMRNMFTSVVEWAKVYEEISIIMRNEAMARN
jgi:hypothetical protein